MSVVDEHSSVECCFDVSPVVPIFGKLIALHERPSSPDQQAQFVGHPSRGPFGVV